MLGESMQDLCVIRTRPVRCLLSPEVPGRGHSYPHSPEAAVHSGPWVPIFAQTQSTPAMSPDSLSFFLLPHPPVSPSQLQRTPELSASPLCFNQPLPGDSSPLPLSGSCLPAVCHLDAQHCSEEPPHLLSIWGPIYPGFVSCKLCTLLMASGQGTK